MNDSNLRYRAERQPGPGETYKGHPIEPYLPDDDLKEAANLAIDLRRPLLVMGEPGCGKTRLALAVAYDLQLPYESWHIQSVSRARDGRYIYDTVARLRDAQLAANGLLKPDDVSEKDDPYKYVRWGPIGEAFRSEEPTVVLIDEIDKADPDFANDLLLELDELWFPVEELVYSGFSKEDRKVQAQHKPIIFITSNDERRLPNALLRRCLFHEIQFPEKKERLVEIIMAHCPATAADLVGAAAEYFLELRQQMKDGRADKLVSTSEIIDWVHALIARDKTPDDIKSGLLYPGVVLKTLSDYRRFYQEKFVRDEAGVKS